MKQKKFFYWAPFFGKVATIKAVLNSAESFSKYSKNKYQPCIIDCFGEWDEFEEDIKFKNINILKVNKKIKFNTHITGFFKSRALYLSAFFFSFFRLKKLLINEKPDFFIIHLFTSLPILLFTFFKFDTELILRISGLPKMNIFRKILWKYFSKNIKAVITPTEETKKFLVNKNIFQKEKIFHLKDPIIDIQSLKKEIKINNKMINLKKPYFTTVGRYTKQKNHLLLIKAIKEMKDNLKGYTFFIVGYGEYKKTYLDFINKHELTNQVKLIDYTDSVSSIIKESTCVISTSLWEDPGWVMIEAASMGVPIISSNCPNGPNEFLENNKCGLLFKNNSLDELKKTLSNFLNLSKLSISLMTLNAKKKSKYYTKFQHYKKFNEILEKAIN